MSKRTMREDDHFAELRRDNPGATIYDKAVSQPYFESHDLGTTVKTNKGTCVIGAKLRVFALHQPAEFRIGFVVVKGTLQEGAS